MHLMGTVVPTLCLVNQVKRFNWIARKLKVFYWEDLPRKNLKGATQFQTSPFTPQHMQVKSLILAEWLQITNAAKLRTAR